MAARKIFTPELIANGRRRYEESDEPVPSIAADFGVDVRTMNKYVHRWGWTPRSQRQPHGLSLLASLCDESKDIPAPRPPNAATVSSADAGTETMDTTQRAMSSEIVSVPEDEWAERRAAMIEPMERRRD
jgi:hypothetical protein